MKANSPKSEEVKDKDSKRHQSKVGLNPIVDDEEGKEENGPSRLFSILLIAVEQQQQHQQQKQPQQSAVTTEEKTTWDDLVRRWLDTHPDAKERREAAYFRGGQHNNATTLHLVCQLDNNTPIDIVQDLVDAAPDIAGWKDNRGWLPLHHACANRGSPELLSILIDAYPDGKITQTSVEQQAPLHIFLLSCGSNTVSTMIDEVVESVELLCEDCQAAQLTDDKGMLPIHCACAIGSSFFEVLLSVLVDAYPHSPIANEQKGRTPLQLAMINAHHDTSPNAILFLLHGDGNQTVNLRDHDGLLPLHALAKGLQATATNGNKNEGSVDSKFKNRQRRNIQECLDVYLRVGKPDPSVDFLPTLQRLPQWLKESAVINPHVQCIRLRINIQLIHSLSERALEEARVELVLEAPLASKKQLDW